MGLGIPAAEVEAGDPRGQPAVGQRREEDRLASGRGERVEEGLVVEVEGGVPRHADPAADGRGGAGFPCLGRERSIRRRSGFVTASIRTANRCPA